MPGSIKAGIIMCPIMKKITALAILVLTHTHSNKISYHHYTSSFQQNKLLFRTFVLSHTNDIRTPRVIKL